MVQKCYPQEINRLLRKYLKFGKVAEFDRLAAYSEMWGTLDEQSYIYLALRPCRYGDDEPHLYYLNKLEDAE